MNDVVKMGKCGCVSTGIWLVQGDTRSHVLRIHVPRMEGGVDLKDLGWIIKITNEAGVGDVDVPVTGSVVIDERTIAFDWLIHGVATAVPGKTIFSVEGVDETSDGKPIIWRSDSAMMYIRENHEATPSEEAETELGELQKMIVYVNGELENVIAAGEMARSAATHQPIIGGNGNWFLWDIEKGIYVDSGTTATGSGDGSGSVVNLTFDDTLKYDELGRLSVNTATAVDENNDLPITAAAVFVAVGNINSLLSTI